MNAAGAQSPEPRPIRALPEGIELAVAPERCFDALYGLEILSEDPVDGTLRGRVEIREELKQPFGLVHGGVVASMAEALASRGTIQGVAADGNIAAGQSNETSFLRPLLCGYAHAVARPRDRGRDTWLWEVETFDDDGRLCALSYVTIAVRAPRED